jgi:hypothetical protein
VWSRARPDIGGFGNGEDPAERRRKLQSRTYIDENVNGAFRSLAIERMDPQVIENMVGTRRLELLTSTVSICLH